MLPVPSDPHFELTESTSQPQDFTSDSFAAALRRHRYGVLAWIALALALGIAYTLLQTPVFRATSLIRFEL
jgi:uncharacterized protein involved in exopolysaccharide biosynthesis